MSDFTLQMRNFAPVIRAEELDIIGHHIQAYARTQPNKLALIDGDRTLTWAELLRYANQVANQLRSRGLQPGDTVAILSENNADFVAVFLGTLIAGGCVVPLPTMVSADALARMINDSLTRWLFVSRINDTVLHELEYQLDRILPECCIGLNYAPDISHLDMRQWLAGCDDTPQPANVDQAAPFNLIYSSGTTGAPKGIVHDHRFRSRQTLQLKSLGFTGDVVNLVSTPIYSHSTLISVLPTLYHGATLVLMPKFEAHEFLELAQRHRVTFALLVPTQYRRLLSDPEFDSYDLSSFTLKISTGSPLRPQTIGEIMARWPGNLRELYGLTEGGIATTLDCGTYPEKWASVGMPVGITDIRIIDDTGNELPPGQTGEIVGRSGAMMRGYYRSDTLTRNILWTSPEGDVFFRSGDMGLRDDDGFLYISDRRKDMILSGGLNIYASDLESVLFDHPAVEDVAVIGVPHEQWGETPLALVVPKDEPDKTSTTEILAWANERLGRHQRLAAVEWIDELPYSAIGKLLKSELRARYVP